MAKGEDDQTQNYRAVLRSLSGAGFWALAWAANIALETVDPSWTGWLRVLMYALICVGLGLIFGPPLWRVASRHGWLPEVSWSRPAKAPDVISHPRDNGAGEAGASQLRFRPFDQRDVQYVHETWYTGDRNNKVMFVAVRPVATGEPISGCRGYLNAVWRMGDNMQWEPTAYTDIRPLMWGGTNAEAVRIDADKNQVLNVFVVELSTGGEPKPCIRPEARLNKHEGSLSDPDGIYRFDVLVEGGNGSSAKTSLMFWRKNAWNDFEVKEIEPWKAP